MFVDLFDTEDFSKWVSQIFLSIDLLKINVTSIYNLSNKVKAMQNMLDSLVRLRFFRLNHGFSAGAV